MEFIKSGRSLFSTNVNFNHINPLFGGPPLPISHQIGNKTHWTRLDPNEILVHNLKSLD
jgi:hypothetical protein